MIQSADLAHSCPPPEPFGESRILPFPGVTRTTQPESPAEKLTLRNFYETRLLPHLSDLKEGSLACDRSALNMWERHTEDVCLKTTTVADLIEQVKQLRSGLKGRNLSAPTINKHWRELKPMFEHAARMKVCEEVPIIEEFRKGRVVRGSLLPEPPKVQRQLVTADDVCRLFEACKNATYPRCQQFTAPQYWRVALLLFWTYGARTGDFLRHLKWEHVRGSDGILLFTAEKTSKLQGLPLTDTVAMWLSTIRGLSERVFPGFNTAGHQRQTQGKLPSQKPGTWKNGYYTTWRRDIATIIEPEIQFINFRERIVTWGNSKRHNMGHWIAGHYVQGLAQNYENPDDEIKALFKAATVPECFRQLL